MERSGGKEVKTYDCLSAYYDYLLNDPQGYDYWLKYLKEKDFSSVLEIAAGSAMLSGILADEGYEVVASDISEAMKQAAKANFKGPYYLADMRDFDFKRKFDLVVCAVDSINYLSADELDSCFAAVKKHLVPGGRFIFDSHHLSRLNEFADGYIEEGYLEDGVSYQWAISADDLTDTIDQHFCFYFEKEMIQEHHLQNVFEPELLREKMEAAGFKCRIIEDFIPDEKILVIGELYE